MKEALKAGGTFSLVQKEAHDARTPAVQRGVRASASGDAARTSKLFYVLHSTNFCLF
jgi:hypothetical protein